MNDHVEPVTGIFKKMERGKVVGGTPVIGKVSTVTEKGIEGPVSYMDLTVVTERRERLGRPAGKYVMKGIEELEGYPETTSKEVFKKWKWLRSNGYPVVSTLRYDDETKQYLMSDVTRGGKYVIVDKHNPLRESGLEIINRGELVDGIRSIATGAYSSGNGVYLGSDAYAVIVDRQTSQGHIMILDIGRGTLKVADSRARGRQGTSFSQEGALKRADYFIHNYFSS